MAEHLVSIYGTEKDKVNCPFYYKIGACRHGDRCSRVHNKPLFSQTLMLSNLYHSPDQIEEYARLQGLPLPEISAEDRTNHFEDFYQDIKMEMSKFGPVESIFVCDNLAEHLIGNTYVKFVSEKDSKEALASLKGRYYAGCVVKAEFSPVTDFKEGKCRTFEEFGKCKRGDYCHFMHLRKHPENMTDKYGDFRGGYRGKNYAGGYQRGGYRGRGGGGHGMGRTYGTYDYRDDAEKRDRDNRERDNRDSRETRDYRDREDRDSRYSSPAISDDRFDARRSTYDRDDYDRDDGYRRDSYHRRGRGGYRGSGGGYTYNTRPHPKHRDTYGEYDYKKDS